MIQPSLLAHLVPPVRLSPLLPTRGDAARLPAVALPVVA